MVVKCPNCDAALLYNPSSGKMECLHCQNEYEVEELSMAREENIEETVKDILPVEDVVLEDDLETMECNIYACTSCGAELAVNGVESSTFCAYCGQPTVIFSRVSATKKPKYIIPFSVTKEEAVEKIRKELLKGFFIPRSFRKFELERVRGIYIPYWIYDITCQGQVCFSGEVPKKIGKGTDTKYFYREAKGYYHNIVFDASTQLIDDTSRRLEPYDFSKMKDFDMSYLSGFYSDCYDLDKKKSQDIAMKYGQEMYVNNLRKTVNASYVKNIYDKCDYQIKRADYLMLPAWFLTLRYRNESYTILANGQTGKVIGAVPYSKTKIVLLTIILGIIFSSLMIPISHMFFSTPGDVADMFLMMIFLFGAGGLITGEEKYRKLVRDVKLTKSKSTKAYVEERQEK